MPKLHVTLYDTRTFLRKVSAVTIALFLLQPMIYFHLYLPSMLYLGCLILLHLVFLYLYISHIPWRLLVAHKGSLLARFAGILLMIYLLTLCSSRASLKVLFLNTLAAAFLHAAILFLIMVKKLTLVYETTQP